MDQRNENYGRDQNIINQPGTVIINQNTPDLPLAELQGVAPARRLLNYITALLFLLGILFWWLLLGLFTKCEFPLKRIFSLLFDSFFGDGLCKGVEALYQEKIGSSSRDLFNHDGSLQSYNRLNKEKSELQALEVLVKILASGSSDRNEEIDKALEIVQKQKAATSIESTILRKRFDPELDKLYRFYIKFLEGYSDIETDYKKIDNALSYLMRKFDVSPSASQIPSEEQAWNLIEELEQIVLDNRYNIDTSSRLETLRNVLQLLEWMAAASSKSSFKYEFKSEVDSARRAKAIELIIGQAEELLGRILKNISPDTLSSIKRGIREQWIAETSIYGINYRGLAVVELVLEIDWNKFNAWRSSSVFDSTVKVKWGRNRLATEIDKTLNRFNKFLKDNYLTPDWRVLYSPGLDGDEINRILGFENAPLEWDDQNVDDQEEKARVQDLAELGIGLYFRPRKASYFGIKRR